MIPIEIFSHNTARITIQAGQALFREGDEGNQMYVLETGTAEVFVQNQVVETLAHGSIVGEMGLVSPGPHSASVIAKTDCDFVAVDEKRFQFLVQETPYFAIQVMRLMAERTSCDQQVAGGCGSVGSVPVHGKRRRYSLL